MDRVARARGFAALGDPIRLGAVELLQVQDLAPQALATALDVPGNLLAHHLRVLEEAGIVERRQSEADRRRAYVHLRDEALLSLLAPMRRLNASRVLFVCTGNAARSILAESIWRGHTDIPATSAGTHPAPRINPRTRTAARRAGLRLDGHPPQPLEAVLRADDLVISVCDGVNEELSELRNAHLHWSIPDPAKVDTDRAFDATVTDLTHRIERLAPAMALPSRRRRDA